VFAILEDETSVYKEEDAFGSMVPVESTSGDVIVLVPDASGPKLCDKTSSVVVKSTFEVVL